MNRKELIDALSAKTGSSKADADRNIAALIETITSTLKKGDNVALLHWLASARSKFASAQHVPAAIQPPVQS